SGSTDVWLVGDTTILRWDGQHWNSLPAPAPSATGLWVNASSDVWLGAGIKFAYHWTGTTWTSTSLDDNRTAGAIWGSGASDVWAVGEAGVILHFDGSGWSQSVSPTTHALRSAWGSSSGDVWAVGDSGTVLHFTR